jgi:ATP-binding cassette subfamily B protein
MIADKFNLLQMGMIAGERIFKVLENDDFVRNEGTFAPSQIKGELIFQDVWFAYIADQYVLKGVSLHIPAGKVTAIVGSTGSGKTSIVSLINRLYPVNKGKVLLDNEPIEQYELGFLRSKIAVVLQDVFLFSGSVYENITLRNPAVTREMVYEAAQAIGIHDFIMSLPGGYDFNVMERGVTLSLGQRQLISFVRALLYNPAVLILDEATSSVDTESEQLIQHAIDKLIVGRTSIVIAHRLSTIRKAHQIVVIENGVIAETGPHEELIARKGLYQNLHAMQFEQGD